MGEAGVGYTVDFSTGKYEDGILSGQLMQLIL